MAQQTLQEFVSDLEKANMLGRILWMTLQIHQHRILIRAIQNRDIYG